MMLHEPLIFTKVDHLAQSEVSEGECAVMSPVSVSILKLFP